MKGNRSPSEVAAGKFYAGSAVMILAFVAICAATVLAEGRLFRFFFAITGACGLAVAAFLQIRERISGSLAGAEIQDDLRRPIVSGQRIRDVGGALFVVTSIAALIVGIPTVWYFFAVAIGGGVVVALVMRRAHG
jgi:hypothetical protein